MTNIENQIKTKFYNYCIDNDISAFKISSSFGGNNGIYITDHQTHHFTEPFYSECNKEMIKSSDLKDFHIHALNKAKSSLYSKLFQTLDKDEKVYFIKNFFLNYYSDFFHKNPSVFNDDDYWLHFSSIDKKTAYVKSESNAKAIFKTIENRSIDSKIKVESLLNFVNYHKNYFKNSKLKINLINILNLKINKSYFPYFEEIIDEPIEITKTAFINTNNKVISLFLNMDDVFKSIELKNNKIAEINNYNEFFNASIKKISSSKYKQLLGIKDIDVIKATNSSSVFKIFIELSEEKNINFEQLFSSLFVHLSNYENKNISLSIIDKFLDYYLLTLDLNNKKQIKSGFKI